MGSFSTITSVFSGTPCISRYKSNYSNIRIFCIIRIFEYWFHKKRILFVIRIRPILISEYYSLFVFVLFSLFVATLLVKVAHNGPLDSSSQKNGPGGQHCQGRGVVLHVQEEVYQSFGKIVAGYQE